jgi:hypothetical protein
MGQNNRISERHSIGGFGYRSDHQLVAGAIWPDLFTPFPRKVSAGYTYAVTYLYDQYPVARLFRLFQSLDIILPAPTGWLPALVEHRFM